MSKHFRNRIVSALLSASMLFGMAGTALAGGDTMPPREGEQGYLGENQPVYHGHRAYDVLNWSPETDEYASFMRAQVPLQERNEAYNAAQANPTLNQEVQALALMEDYGNEFFNPAQYNDQFAQYCFNFWQYLDIQASWHGTVTNSTPDSLFDPEAGWWERNYEFGVVNIPNPSYTNAAHKNGVKAIGCIFFPRNEHTDDWVFQDENGRFPMADKLVEIANYYGFDGYFINAEEGLPGSFMPVYEEFCRAMTEQGLYIQVYASNLYGQNNQSSWGRIDYYNKTAEQFSNWIKEPGEETIAANSLYMNPGPSVGMVDSSVKTMEALGLDAKDTVFMTLEAGQTGFSGVRGSLNNTLDENLVPRTGIACLGAGTVWAHLDEQVFGHTGSNSYNENRRSDPDYQKYIFARERTWWSGAADQPYYANDDSYIMNGVSFLNKNTQNYTDAERQQLLQAILDATTDPYTTANDPTRNEYDGRSPSHGDFQSWPGMAAFISERSVINGSNFYTSFNTGHGMQYFVDGKVSNDNEWYNMNAQDILPTWQWWIETESENRLGMDFDYGEKYNAGYDYIQVGGYEGPSSLVIFGDVDGKSDIHLYKTDLTVGENTVLDLTYNKPSKTDDSTFSVVLYLKNGDSVKTVYVPVQDANRKTNGWVKTSVDLSAYAGETIAAFGFSVNATNGSVIKNYQMNLGEVRISDGSLNAPATPTGLTLDRMFDTGEAYLSWDLADYDDVQKYNVYAVYEDGTETYVGGAYADYYYVKDTMYNFDGVVTFKVTAEGADGVESAGATVTYDANAIANLSVEEQPGALVASWVNPDLDYAAIRADVTLPDNYYGNTNVYTNTFAKDATTGTVRIDVADGSRYILRLSFLDAEGNVLAYEDHSGNLLDLFCATYKGGLEKRVMSSGWKLINPQVYDWWHLYAWNASGKPLTFKDGRNYAIRGVDDLTGMPVSGDFGYIEVQLEDFNGNLSEKTRVYWGADTKLVDETIFPDAAVLAAVKEQVGDTMADVIAFNGTLDLSGTEVRDLTGVSYLENMTGLNLANTAVTTIAGLSNLKEINITGCAQLQILNLANSQLEKITCDDVSALEALVSVNLTGNRLDLTEGTAEQAFVEAAKAATDGKEDIVSTAPDTTNFAPMGTVIAGSRNLFDGNEGNYVYVNSDTEYTVDLGAAKTVESWVLMTFSSSYVLDGFTLYASDDNETYTEVATVSGLKGGTSEGKLETPVTARYIKFVPNSSTYVKEVKYLGHELISYPAGVTADSQRPVAYLTVPETVAFAYGEGTADLTEIPTYATIRGTEFTSLKDADFIAEDYDIDAQMGAGYDVVYIDAGVGTEVALNVPATYHVSYVKLGETNTSLETVVTVGNDEIRGALEELIKTAEGINRSEYTEEQLKAIDSALENAKDALENAETVQELQEAYDLLKEALNHKWGEWTVVIEATCESDGLKTRTCKCGEETEEEVIPTLGHDYDSVKTDATCLTDGYTTHTCSRCGDSYVDSIVEALGHDYKAVVTAPTHDKMGYTTHTCDRCGDSYVDSYTDALGHDYTQTVTKEPTCTEEGVMAFTCDCGESYTQSIPMVAHTYVDVITEPDCTNMGYTTHTCSVCGHEYVDTIVPALGHDYKDTVVAPTCTEFGYTLHECAVCEHSYISDPVRATGHSYVLTGAKKPACGVDGYTGDMVCEHCGDVKSTGEVIPAVCPSEAFVDLNNTSWYHQGVDFVLDAGLMIGMDETHFAPNGTLTRGQLVTILHRMAGSPASDAKVPFTDVAANDYYAGAVAWAYENGIVLGVTETSFRPSASVTREQLVTFLARYAAFKGVDVKAEGTLENFTDYNTISEYAVEPMTWAVKNGLVIGDGGKLSPKATGTRAQVATILMRYCEKIAE